jgi:hypothetical protein
MDESLGENTLRERMTRAVIRGRTVQDGVPVVAAHVRLLDCAGECNAEVLSGPSGEFRFAAAPGHWTLRALSHAGAGSRDIEANGGVTDLELSLAPPISSRSGGTVARQAPQRVG